MDLTDSLLSVERKIRRRLKWKLLFQEIQNATYDSHRERIVDVKDLELLISTPKEIKSNKKRISVPIGNKFKKLHLKVQHRHNTRQTHSKSFIPEILLKKNEFDTNFHTDYYTKADAKAAFKNICRRYSPVSLKENISYCDVSCPNIICKSYSEVPEISEAVNIHENIKKRSEGIQDKIVKQKKERKSLLEIIDSLHLNNSTNNKCLSNLGNIKNMKKQRNMKQDDNEGVLLSFNKSNSSSNKETVTPNKIAQNLCSTRVLRSKRQKNEPSVIQDIQQNLNSNQEDNGQKIHTVSGLSAPKRKKSGNERCDVLKKPETRLLKEQQCTNKSASELNTVNEKTDCRKKLQNVDDGFKVPAIPSEKTDNAKKGLSNSEIANTLLQLAKSRAIDHHPAKIDSLTAKSINRTRMIIESFLSNISFKQSNLTLGSDSTKLEMCLSESDQQYVYKYAHHINANSWHFYLLSIINYVEQHSPDMTRHILGITVLEATGRTNDRKYKSLVASMKNKIITICKDIERNSFEIYKEYVLWLFGAKGKRQNDKIQAVE